MNLDFINKRIAELCAEKHVSEREVSLAIGRSESYINYITNGKMLPSMEKFLTICEYFNISANEFFDENIEQPLLSKELYLEVKRLSNNDLKSFIDFIKNIEPEEYKMFLQFLEKIAIYYYYQILFLHALKEFLIELINLFLLHSYLQPYE